MKKTILLMIILLGIVSVSAQVGDYSSSYQAIGSSTNVQYYQPGLVSASGWIPTSVYWPEFDREVCRERQDFIVQILPGGCEPAVVRSDLLEEQNVPVFCKLMLIQTNPLIDVSRVKTISFRGKRPEEIAGITYFPPRYNLYTRNDLADTPIDDNIGYFVLSLKQTPREDDMPDWVEGNLTAVINYDVENALGIGRTNFYISNLEDDEWERDYKDYSFWNGKAYLKPESIESDKVTVSVYRDFDTKEGTVTLKKGETSSPMYLGGFYCASGLVIKAEEIGFPKESALLQIGSSQTWVRAGDKVIDNQCTVKEIDATPGASKIKISCPVTNGLFELKLYAEKAGLSVDSGEFKNHTLNTEIKNNLYLAYVGMWIEGGETQKFIVTAADPWAKDTLGFESREIYSTIDKVVTDNKGKIKLQELEGKIKQAVRKEYEKQIPDITYDEKYVSLITEEKEVTVNSATIEEGVLKPIEHQIQLSKDQLLKNKEWKPEEPAYVYYQKAIETYTDLVDFHPQEKRLEDEYYEPYAAEGLYNAAKLAQDFGMYEDREKFYSQLRLNYPDSGWTRIAEEEIHRYLKYDTRESKALVNLRDGSYFVEVLDFKKPTKEELGVDISINGIKKDTLGKDEIITFDSKETIQVTDIQENTVKLQYTKPSENNRNPITETKTLEKGKTEQITFETLNVKLLNINFENQAKLVLDSEVRGPRALANFSYKIGIEKRGIQLSPEKTQEMIKNIEESIGEWEDINEKLGKVVKGLKGACFATSALLTAKNLLTGLSGTSMARNELMTMPGGWNDKCEQLVSQGQYYNLQDCLLDKSQDIEADIQIYAQCIQNTNDKLEKARQGLTESTDIFDFEQQVTDRKAMEQKFREYTNCKTLNEEGFNGECEDLDFDSLKTIYTINCALGSTGSSEVLTTALENEKEKSIREQQERYEYSLAEKKADLDVKALGMELTTLEGDNVVYANIHTVKTSDKFYKEENMEDVSFLVAVTAPLTFSKTNQNGEKEYDIGNLGGEPVLIQVMKDDDGYYNVDANSKIFKADGTKVEELEYKAVREFLSQQKATKFAQATSKAYENEIKNINQLTVKYFDRAPYKGLPAEVPFDVRKGWYVEMEYILSGFGTPYDESGRLVNFYICNVGKNGEIEFKRKADDICRYYNGEINDISFPGLSTTESRTLVTRAKQAVTEATRYYGKEEAYINGQKFSTGISLGGESGQCTDFMSPTDCNILFNVCDPVICPSSRCDLGGNFPVDNVIQTGIIGSLVLCLPNMQEGIYIPICLSGVHAGIEGYLSILEAHKDCLNESLTTGKTIGICDEIKSIYLCEFFWRQMVPFADILLPKLIESFFSQGARGGGEYLTVQNAWDNTQKSIDYFTDEYAVNSMEAFQMRSKEEAGTEICKRFISTQYPTDLDILTEPDSPVQYHAWFDEIPMTTTTPYPTSHYKVYYHIYAGNDQGAYYTVYLKGIPEEFSSSYTYRADFYVVDQGYAPIGDTIDQAKDFTAPSGYQELCVNINGQDECGFGKVSTSFAVNYITDLYVQDQIEQQITTSEECVAGTASVYSLAQPNLQSGAEELVESELYNKGITRVCSTYNPGKQVGPTGEYDTTNSTYDRWKDVGYCDDETLRCWLDTDSVKDVVKNKELEEEILSEVDTSLINSAEYIHYNQSKLISEKYAKIDQQTFKLSEGATEEEIQKAIGDIEEELQELATLSLTNAYRARGLLLLGNLYGKVASLAKGSDTQEQDPTGNAETKQKVAAVTTGGRQENINEDDDYEVGDQVTNTVTGNIWTKQSDGTWKSNGETKTYEELIKSGYVTSVLKETSETSESQKEEEEEYEEIKVELDKNLPDNIKDLLTLEYVRLDKNWIRNTIFPDLYFYKIENTDYVAGITSLKNLSGKLKTLWKIDDRGVYEWVMGEGKLTSATQKTIKINGEDKNILLNERMPEGVNLVPLTEEEADYAKLQNINLGTPLFGYKIEGAQEILELTLPDTDKGKLKRIMGEDGEDVNSGFGSIINTIKVKKN